MTMSKREKKKLKERNTKSAQMKNVPTGQMLPMRIMEKFKVREKEKQDDDL